MVSVLNEHQLSKAVRIVVGAAAIVLMVLVVLLSTFLALNTSQGGAIVKNLLVRHDHCDTFNSSVDPGKTGVRQLRSVRDYEALTDDNVSLRFQLECIRWPPEFGNTLTPQAEDWSQSDADANTTTTLFYVDKAIDLHYTFAKGLGITDNHTHFDYISYFTHRGRRKLVNGGLVLVNHSFVIFEFWPTDIMQIEEIYLSYRMLRETSKEWGTQFAYRPGGIQQQASVQKHAALLRKMGIPLWPSLTSSSSEPQVTWSAYNYGTSIGLLRFGSNFDANSIALFAGNAPPDLQVVGLKVLLIFRCC
jgi:hypothetical protein